MKTSLTLSTLILSFIIHAVLTGQLRTESKMMLGECYYSARPESCRQSDFIVVNTTDNDKWCCVKYVYTDGSFPTETKTTSVSVGAQNSDTISGSEASAFVSTDDAPSSASSLDANNKFTSSFEASSTSRKVFRNAQSDEEQTSSAEATQGAITSSEAFEENIVQIEELPAEIFEEAVSSTSSTQSTLQEVLVSSIESSSASSEIAPENAEETRIYNPMRLPTTTLSPLDVFNRHQMKNIGEGDDAETEIGDSNGDEEYADDANNGDKVSVESESVLEPSIESSAPSSNEAILVSGESEIKLPDPRNRVTDDDDIELFEQAEENFESSINALESLVEISSSGNSESGKEESLDESFNEVEDIVESFDGENDFDASFEDADRDIGDIDEFAEKGDGNGDEAYADDANNSDKVSDVSESDSELSLGPSIASSNENILLSSVKLPDPRNRVTDEDESELLEQVDDDFESSSEVPESLVELSSLESSKSRISESLNGNSESKPKSFGGNAENSKDFAESFDDENEENDLDETDYDESFEGVNEDVDDNDNDETLGDELDGNEGSDISGDYNATYDEDAIDAEPESPSKNVTISESLAADLPSVDVANDGPPVEEENEQPTLDVVDLPAATEEANEMTEYEDIEEEEVGYDEEYGDETEAAEQQPEAFEEEIYPDETDEGIDSDESLPSEVQTNATSPAPRSSQASPKPEKLEESTDAPRSSQTTAKLLNLKAGKVGVRLVG